MNLPENFLSRMRELLKEEYDDFVSSYSEVTEKALRLNTLKTDRKIFEEKELFELKQIPWSDKGYFYKDSPGKHPYHEAGLYYIQEASAMAVGTTAAPTPGLKVLDLCAAPGGKASHLASFMNNEGVLVANEPVPSRAAILSRNIERMGIRNCVVTNEKPEQLAQLLEHYFDMIVVDAPCSGEGMFRKDKDTANQWSRENVEMCSDRQKSILESALKMLKPGGRIVYSTCTFSPEENEMVIENLLDIYSELILEDTPEIRGASDGRPEWSKTGTTELRKCMRIWPHKSAGEGHFIAALKDTGSPEENRVRPFNSNVTRKGLKHYFSFCEEFMKFQPEGNFMLFGDNLYIVPEDAFCFDGIKIVRAGWHLGTFKKERFEPSHALALSIKKEDAASSIDLDSDSKEVVAYLKGETLKKEGRKGWTLVTVDGFPLGWGKMTGNTLKNHYPKGLRWRF